MKITICGSCAFIKEMKSEAAKLTALGHEVKFPPEFANGLDGKPIPTEDYYKIKKTLPKRGEFWDEHRQRIRDHFEKVGWAEAILVANYEKNGVANYIGPNTLMEMGVAFYLDKKIFLLNPVPELPWKEEVLGMRPLVINGVLENI